MRVVGELRSLGLTLKEIQDFAAIYLARTRRPYGPHLARLLDRAQQRIEERLKELETIRRRLLDFRARNADALLGSAPLDLARDDPRAGRRS